jgi:tripartite-type tricarboxylate transporter receptor subunit TctC
LIKLSTGLNITNIPYKGSGPALIDLVAGQIHAGFFNFVASAPFVESGRLRGIIVSGTKRAERLPSIPTAKEVGIAGFEENAGYMIMVPGTTPADVVGRLHKEILRTLHTPEVKSRLAAEGSEVVGSTTEQATASLIRQMDQMADLIRRTGIKL